MQFLNVFADNCEAGCIERDKCKKEDKGLFATVSNNL